MTENQTVSIWRLIAIPALITLAVTLLRLTGELEHWGMPFFGNKAGGEGAIVGITWLPIIFGPWFALKLMKAGSGWRSAKSATGWLLAGLVLFVVSGFAGETFVRHNLTLAFLFFEGMLIAAILPIFGWPSLGRTLFAYAFSARIPVLIVMYFAMRGNGGAGWGTHYDAVESPFKHLALAQRYFDMAIIPQTTLWIGWTVIVGGVLGLITVAIARPGRRAVQATP